MSTRKFKQDIYESKNLEDSFLSFIYPQKALGEYLPEDARENGYVLVFVILLTVVGGILSVLVYEDLNSDEDADKQTLNMSIAIMSIFWIVFVSFIFLLFGATRFFHIVLFITTIVLSSLVLEKVEGTSHGMTIAVLVISSILFLTLSYYLTLSRTTGDVRHLREKERLLRKDEKYNRKIETLRDRHEEEIQEKNREIETLEKEVTRLSRN